MWCGGLMQERTRYRITGSIFLLAMAVILLPMLFDKPAPPISPAPPPVTIAVPDSTLQGAVVIPQSDVVEQVQSLRDEVDDEGFATDTGTRFGEPTLSVPDELTAVWAVQAAAFANQDNAFAFRQQLREAGYEAFISTIKGADAEALHRVAVGPLLSEVEAQQMVEVITERFSVSPRIVAMGN